jgi:hypothetical protein
MVRSAYLLGMAAVGAVLWAQQAIASPHTRYECQDKFLKVELPKYFIFADDNGNLEGGISYIRGQPYEEVVRKTTGKDLLDAGVIELENFRVVDRKEVKYGDSVTENVLFSARLRATEEFQVVAYKDGNEWKPKIVKGLDYQANIVAYVAKDTIFDGIGWIQFTEYSPPPPPPSPFGLPPQGNGAPGPDMGPSQEPKPWWQK